MSFLTKLIEPKNPIPLSRQRFDNRVLAKLILPIIGEQFLVVLVGMADTLMVSYAGEAAVSGVSLVDQLNNVFILVFTALASGGAVVASQYVGRGDRENGEAAAGQLVMSVTAVAVLLTAVTLLAGQPIFRALFGAGLGKPFHVFAEDVHLGLFAHLHPVFEGGGRLGLQREGDAAA